MGKQSEPRSLEEFVRGPDGEEEQGLTGAIRRAVEEAKGRSSGVETVDRVFVICRVTPAAGGGSSGAWNTRFTVNDPILTVADRILAHLEGNPGPAFHGQIRIDFKAGGDSTVHLCSFTRSLRPEALPDDGGGVAGPVMAPPSDDPFRHYFRPMMDLTLQATSAQVATMNAAAARETASASFFKAMSDGLTGMVAAMRGATPTADGGGGIMTLLSSALGIAQAAGVSVPAPAQAAVNVARQITDRTAPPPPSPIPSTDVPAPPSPVTVHTSPPVPVPAVNAPAPSDGAGRPGFDPASLTREQVAAWAQANPGEAKSMIADQARANGAPEAIIKLITG